MPELLANVIPASLSVLILLLILSASMSTLAALVLISSSSVAKDIYAGFIKPRKRLHQLERVVTIDKIAQAAEERTFSPVSFGSREHPAGQPRKGQ